MSGNAQVMVACALLGLTSDAIAQWSVTNLHPDGVTARSSAYGSSGSQQVGVLYLPHCMACPTPTYACMWNGSAGTWQNLHPKAAGRGFSWAFATNGTHQAGSVDVRGLQHASLWSGTAESWVDLHPAGADESSARGISGSQTVGYVVDNFVPRASLWTGNADSWVDLHPSAATSSVALGVHESHQVGYAIVGGSYHASLWSGSAQSWVDLHPASAQDSTATSVQGSQQAGWARIGGVYHASLWTGTAESRIDLHPSWATYSTLAGTCGTQQVGQADSGGFTHAALWYGTVESWVDLSAMLPAGFSHSSALSIWSDGVVTQVAGNGVNTITGRTEALLWTIPARRCRANIVNSPASVFRVDVDDLLAVILTWGCASPRGTCVGDVNDSGAVDTDDLISIITSWGPCQ